MRRISVLLAVVLCGWAAVSAPRKVALVVQNHTSDAPVLPMESFADTLSARISGDLLRVVNPHNAIGVDQNRSAAGETMPLASAQEIGRMLGAEGVVTASLQEFTSEEIGVPAIAHKLKVRMALNLADSATGETVCGVDGVEVSKNYTVEKVNADNSTLFEGLMHSAAAKAAEKLLAKAAVSEWSPGKVEKLTVFFGCNVLGADIQIDGMSYGTCPAQLSLTPGVHTVAVSYPPYFTKFERRAMFDQQGQTFAAVLQLSIAGEEQRERNLAYEAKLIELEKSRHEFDLEKENDSIERANKILAFEKRKNDIETERMERCELFKKQLELADAMLERYTLSGEADDYVRKTIADGTSVYWKNSFGRIAITDGSTDNIEFATPSTDAADLAVPPGPSEIGEKLQKFLMKGR